MQGKSNKNPRSFFLDSQADSKIYMEMQGAQDAQTDLKQNKFRGLILYDCKTNYKTTINKTVCVGIRIM